MSDKTLLDELKRLEAIATHGGFDDRFSFSYEIMKHSKALIAAVEALYFIQKRSTDQMAIDLADEALRPFKEKAK